MPKEIQNKKELYQEWDEFFTKKSQHLDQTYLTADTRSIIIDFLHSKLQEAIKDERERIIKLIESEIRYDLIAGEMYLDKTGEWINYEDFINKIKYYKLIKNK